MSNIRKWGQENKVWLAVIFANLVFAVFALVSLQNAKQAMTNSEEPLDNVQTVRQALAGYEGDGAAFNAGLGIEEECDYYTLEVESDGDLLFVCHTEAVPTVTPEATASPTATDEPTVTPVVTPTVEGSLPLCTEHDDTAYHGLIDEANDCHFAHTHGDDINSYAGIFGQWPLTQEISYPFQTDNENLLKHAGYKVYSFDTGGVCVGEGRVPSAVGCVIAGRLQFHVIGGAAGMNTRFHSYYGEFQVLNPDGTTGTVSTGGHSDFGILHCPYKSEHCELGSDPESFNILQPTYRAARQGIGDGVAQWNSGCHNSRQVPCDTNKIFSYDWVAFDDWGGVNPDNLPEVLLSDDPERNHSALRFYEFVIMTPAELGNGKVNYEGFTDIYGNIDESCTETTAVCVPLVIENVQAGTHLFRTSVGTSGQPPQDRYYREWDLSPEGESWIEYPN